MASGQNPAEIAQRNTQPAPPRVGLRLEQSYHEGPIPSADELAKIDEIIPGGANRILAMAEKDAEHIREMQGLAVGAEATELRRARTASIVVPLSGMSFGLVFALLGNPTGGASICVAAMLPQLVTAILRAKSGPKKDT